MKLDEPLDQCLHLAKCSILIPVTTEKNPNTLLPKRKLFPKLSKHKQHLICVIFGCS